MTISTSPHVFDTPGPVFLPGRAVFHENTEAQDGSIEINGPLGWAAGSTRIRDASLPSTSSYLLAIVSFLSGRLTQGRGEPQSSCNGHPTFHRLNEHLNIVELPHTVDITEHQKSSALPALYQLGVLSKAQVMLFFLGTEMANRCRN